jgi:hypothetical protein
MLVKLYKYRVAVSAVPDPELRSFVDIACVNLQINISKGTRYRYYLA